MFGISFSELLVIFIIAFFILGPKRLSEFAGTLGKTLGKLRQEMTHWRETQLSEVDSTALYNAQTELNKTLSDLKRTAKDVLLDEPNKLVPIKTEDES